MNGSLKFVIFSGNFAICYFFLDTSGSSSHYTSWQNRCFHKCVLRRYGTWMTLSRDFRLLSQYCSSCWARTSYRRIYQKKTWQLTRHSSIKTIFCSYVVTLQVGTLRGFDYTVITLIQTCISIQYSKSFSRLSLVLDKNAEHQVWLTNAVCLLYSCIQGQQASIQFCFNRLLSPRPDGLNYWGNLLFYE